MMFIQKSYDPDKLEKLNLEFDAQEKVLKDRTSGEIVNEDSAAVRKARRLKFNWNLVGPTVAVLIFVMGWAGVVSERAFSAMFQAQQNAQQIDNMNLKHVDAQEQIAQQSLMIERLMQIFDRQDQIIQMYNKINEDRHSDNKEHFGRLYKGLSDISDLERKIDNLSIELQRIRLELEALRKEKEVQ